MGAETAESKQAKQSSHTCITRVDGKLAGAALNYLQRSCAAASFVRLVSLLQAGWCCALQGVQPAAARGGHAAGRTHAGARRGLATRLGRACFNRRRPLLSWVSLSIPGGAKPSWQQPRWLAGAGFLAEEVGGLPQLVQVQLPLGRYRRELDARVQLLELLQQLLQQRLHRQIDVQSVGGSKSKKAERPGLQHAVRTECNGCPSRSCCSCCAVP